MVPLQPLNPEPSKLESKITITVHAKPYLYFDYYEYKFHVSQDNLNHIISLLEEFYGKSDPYSQGIVDSIYYDTLEELCLSDCINGQSEKSKFRIRGYGDGTYNQVHQKMKELCGVSKYKSSITIQKAPKEVAPNWETLQPAKKNHPDFQMIMFHARNFGPMLPSIRVKYYRYRYRTFDYRITLDTNVEVFSLQNGLPRRQGYAQLPYHVLEIKCRKLRPTLPFVGLVKLPQISFSKFMLGMALLNE